MNQVYFIHLVLARLGLRQAFEVTSNASMASSNDSSSGRAPKVLASVTTVWVNPALLWGLAIWIMVSCGCVGTRISPPPPYNGCDFQPPPHHSKPPCRLGLFGRRLGQDVCEYNGECNGECNCAMTSGIEAVDIENGLAAEEAHPQPRESLTLPWLREGHKSKPPEVSRFLPVPTRPVFQPQAFDW